MVKNQLDQSIVKSVSFNILLFTLQLLNSPLKLHGMPCSTSMELRSLLLPEIPTTARISLTKSSRRRLAQVHGQALAWLRALLTRPKLTLYSTALLARALSNQAHSTLSSATGVLQEASMSMSCPTSLILFIIVKIASKRSRSLTCWTPQALWDCHSTNSLMISSGPPTTLLKASTWTLWRPLPTRLKQCLTLCIITRYLTNGISQLLTSKVQTSQAMMLPQQLESLWPSAWTLDTSTSETRPAQDRSLSSSPQTPN